MSNSENVGASDLDPTRNKPRKSGGRQHGASAMRDALAPIRDSIITKPYTRKEGQHANKRPPAPTVNFLISEETGVTRNARYRQIPEFPMKRFLTPAIKREDGNISLCLDYNPNPKKDHLRHTVTILNFESEAALHAFATSILENLDKL